MSWRLREQCSEDDVSHLIDRLYIIRLRNIIFAKIKVINELDNQYQ